MYNGKSHVTLKTDNSLQTNVNEKIVKLLGVKVNHKISIELYLTAVSKKSHSLARLSLIYLFIYLFIYFWEKTEINYESIYKAKWTKQMNFIKGPYDLFLTVVSQHLKNYLTKISQLLPPGKFADTCYRIVQSVSRNCAKCMRWHYVEYNFKNDFSFVTIDGQKQYPI